MSQAANFASSYRAAVNQLLDARAALKALREQDGTLGLVAAMQASDLAGTNADLVPATGAAGAAFTAAFTTVDELESILTDFTKTPPAPTAALAALLKFRP